MARKILYILILSLLILNSAAQTGGDNVYEFLNLTHSGLVSSLGWGFGVNTSILNIEFGRASYHLAGSSNHVSLIMKTDKVYKKLWIKN
ncbi:MAG: hypothetical protein H6Q23_1817 [Bacteroidetes bacterium]|nr:hypothetical protein [Bacteroidota bacterium]